MLIIDLNFILFFFKFQCEEFVHFALMKPNDISKLLEHTGQRCTCLQENTHINK